MNGRRATRRARREARDAKRNGNCAAAAGTRSAQRGPAMDGKHQVLGEGRAKTG
ncbi:MAG: hypothetical protein NUW23_14185 [Firmicutes bacterium]|nr:hypothetical protein [Bacillota bacterium]